MTTVLDAFPKPLLDVACKEPLCVPTLLPADVAALVELPEPAELPELPELPEPLETLL